MKFKILSIVPLKADPQQVRVVAEGIMNADNAYSSFEVGEMVDIGGPTTQEVEHAQPVRRRINTRDGILNSENKS